MACSTGCEACEAADVLEPATRVHSASTTRVLAKVPTSTLNQTKQDLPRLAGHARAIGLRVFSPGEMVSTSSNDLNRSISRIQIATSWTRSLEGTIGTMLGAY